LESATSNQGPEAAAAAEQMVNQLANRHLEERQVMEFKWESDLAHLRETQHREFREWVMCVHEEYKTTEKGAAPPPSACGTGGASMSKSESSFSVQSLSSSSLQESFTITLGAQLKAMHNLRLVAADPIDLVRYPLAEEEALPKRLQTSMSLYGSNLAGLVLLSDGRPTEPLLGGSGIRDRFAGNLQY